MESESKRQVLSTPNQLCPPEILKQQVGIEVKYVGFDGQPLSGIIEVNEAVAGDVKTFFEQALLLRFPIEKIAPALHSVLNQDTHARQ